MGSGQLLRGKQTKGSRRRALAGGHGGTLELQIFLASVTGAQAHWLKIGNDPEAWPIDDTGESGNCGGSNALSSQTSRDPGRGLGQDWNRKSWQDDPGRLQTCGQAVRA